MRTLTTFHKSLITGILFVILGSGALRVYLSSVENHSVAQAVRADYDKPRSITIHIAGAVEHPGVYTVRSDSRLDEAIKAAGGFSAGADRSSFNLAARVADGEKITIPSSSDYYETAGPPSGKTPLSEISASPQPDNTANPSSRRTSSSTPSKLRSGATAININTASSTQLQRIPGIGPALAGRIIAYRTAHGPFPDPSRIVDVSGIGQKKYQHMRPYIVTQ